MLETTGRKLTRMKHVDIFSGIGGFPLGFEWAGLSEPSMFCEIDSWCRQVLKKHWPTVTITNDVKELADDPEKLVPNCDIITGGYPCQPFSVTGKQKAQADDRHLWPYLHKIIAQKRPTYAVLENVHGHIGLGLDTVLLDLEAEGYSTRTFVVPACAVNAPHRRDRLWIVAYANSIDQRTRNRSKQSQRNTTRECTGNSSSVGGKRMVADFVKERTQRGEGNYRSRMESWESEPNVGRVAHGIPKRVDRLRGLGNAIVPQIAMQIGLTIKEMEAQKT